MDVHGGTDRKPKEGAGPAEVSPDPKSALWVSTNQDAFPTSLLPPSPSPRSGFHGALFHQPEHRRQNPRRRRVSPSITQRIPGSNRNRETGAVNRGQGPCPRNKERNRFKRYETFGMGEMRKDSTRPRLRRMLTKRLPAMEKGAVKRWKWKQRKVENAMVTWIMTGTLDANSK